MENNMEILINDYVRYLEEIKHLNPKTIKVYIPHIKNMINYCSYKNIVDLENATIIQLNKWINSKNDMSNQYINQMISSAKSFFGFLIAYRYISFNPAKELKALTVPTKSKVSNINESKQIRKYLKTKYEQKPNFNNLRNMLMIDIMLSTGVRNSELRSIDIDTINKETGQFTIKQKGNTMKTCQLNDITLELYNKYLKERVKINSKDNALFISSYKSRISSKGLQKVVDNICKEMNIEHLTPHSMRHICGSSLISAGVPVEQVSKILGHSNVNTTYRWYMHVDEDDRKQIVNSNPLF